MVVQKLGVILVNYNGIEYNEACINSIRASDWQGDIQIYVVDNDSIDGSPTRLLKCYGSERWFHIIFMGKNAGFSVANNVGLRKAVKEGCNFLMLLNNDTYIEKDMIRKLVECAEGKVCIVAPKIYYWDQKDVIWSAGGSLSPIIKKPRSFGENEKDTEIYNQKRECTYLNGCCMLFSAQTFHRVGDMDEDFFLYYEDTEYCMRAAERRVQLFYCPKARMYHKVSASTGGRSNPSCAYYISRNWPMCMKKRMKKFRFLLFGIYFCVNRIVCFSIWRFQGRKDMINAGIEGIIEFVSGKKGRYEGDRVQ